MLFSSEHSKVFQALLMSTVVYRATFVVFQRSFASRSSRACTIFEWPDPTWSSFKVRVGRDV